MSKEKKNGNTIVLVSSPQNSRDAGLPRIDLLADPDFKRVVERFDRALGVEENQSLAESNQFASVVMSVASHSSYIHKLREILTPGRIHPGDTSFKLCYIGHSVGEMASFIEAGITDINTMAWILSERQKITEQPFAKGVMRFMLAVVGTDIKKFEKKYEKQIEQAFGKTLRVTLANRNTPSQGVLSIEAPEGDPKSFANRFNELFTEFQHPDSRRPPRFIPLSNIGNAFHNFVLKPEELILQKTIATRLTKDDFKVPESGVVYSPMLRGWVRSEKDAWKVINHQLTSEVMYSEGIEKLLREGLALFVAADTKEDVTPKMLKENVGDRKPVDNIKDQKSLNQTVEHTLELLAA